MNKQICIIIFLFTCRICNAQNLVPNPSFENTSQCPYGFSQINFALPWFDASTVGTPDYFSECNNPNNIVHVPNNVFGYEYARTGQAYAGIYTWTGSEYIQTQLIDSLIAGVNYRVSFYVSLADSLWYANSSIGAYFSQNVIIDNTGNVLPYTPQISNTSANPLTNKNGWTLVSDTFTALGGEKFMTIGNFVGDANSDTVFVGGGSNPYSYYYIDDVSVIADSLTGINEYQSKFDNIKVYPNPFANTLKVSVNDNLKSQIIIYDITSRKLLQKEFTNSTLLNTEQLAKGLYLYEMRNKDGSCKKGKVVKD